jgi:predicted PurR-regulated permease PerM
MSNQNDPLPVMSEPHSILRPTLLISATLLTLIILKLGNAVAGPLLFFIFLAILVVPLFDALKRRGLSAGLSLVIMLVGITAVFVGLAWLVLSSFSQMLEALSQYNLDFQANTQGIIQSLESIQIDPAVVESINQTLFGYLGGVVRSVLASSVALIAGGIMALIALAFIMLESDSFSQRLHRGLGDGNDLLLRMELFQKSLLSYVVARVKLNFFTAMGVFIMLIIFRVDYALLWSVLAFFLSFIPYIGLIVAMIPAILLGTAESGVMTGVLLAIGYFIINQVIEQVIEPRVVGKEMTLSPTLTLFSVIFWTWVLGGMGAMLAGPLAALMILVFGSFDDTRWIAILFSSDNSPLVTGIFESPDGETAEATSDSSASDYQES